MTIAPVTGPVTYTVDAQPPTACPGGQVQLIVTAHNNGTETASAGVGLVIGPIPHISLGEVGPFDVPPQGDAQASIWVTVPLLPSGRQWIALVGGSAPDGSIVGGSLVVQSPGIPEPGGVGGLVGQVFSFDDSANSGLSLPHGMAIGQARAMTEGASGVFGTVFVASEGPQAARSLLVFARANGPTVPEIGPTGVTIMPQHPIAFTVTNVFDLTTDIDEGFELSACRVGTSDDDHVVALVGPPDLQDDRGRVRGARRAWRFTTAGLTELHAGDVTCELL